MFDDLSEADLKLWIETSLKEGSHILASGLQGQTLKYQSPQHQLVIKIPHGKGLLKKLHVFMVQHEYRVYQKLSSLETVPECYGLVDQQYLVLQYIDAQPIRHCRPENEEVYFQKLFDSIEKMHALGVAHFDLKKRDNLLVERGDTPCIIDFGAAVINKPGFHPLRNYWFRVAKHFDYNAWIKLKYQNQFDQISIDDRQYYNVTFIEWFSRKIKRFYKDHLRYKRK